MKTKILERNSTHQGIYNDFTFDNSKMGPAKTNASSLLQTRSIGSRKTYVLESQDGVFTGTDPRGVQSTVISKEQRCISLDPPEYVIDSF